MQDIFDWLSKHTHWLVLLLLEGISLALLLSYNGYQGSVWFTSANRVVGQVQEWRQDVVSYISLTERNEELMQRNIELQNELDLLRDELSELKHDSSYTERAMAARLLEYPILPAKVVNNNITLHDNFLTINKGRADGVALKMGVVSGTGIVGIVSQVGEHYSLVMSVLNTKSSISCRIRGSNYFGYLRWQGGNILTATLDDVPRHANFKLGDAVETSGFSNIFPSGVFVGRIVHIADSKDGLSYQLTIQLSSDIAKLRDVAVILRKDDTDIVQ